MILHRSFRGLSRFNGLQIVPRALVPVARASFISQGIGPEAVSDTGEIDPQALIALAFDKMELRTALTPDLVIDLKSPSDPETAALLNEIKPHVVLRGRAGRVEIAPYGMEIPEPTNQWSAGVKIAIGAAAVALGLGLISKAVL